MEPDSERVSAVLDCLADKRRRYVIRSLRDDGRMSLTDLAEVVAMREREEPTGEPPAESIKPIYVSLYHNHVPKLEAADLVEYSPSRETVAPGEAMENAIPLFWRSSIAKARRCSEPLVAG